MIAAFRVPDSVETSNCESCAFKALCERNGLVSGNCRTYKRNYRTNYEILVRKSEEEIAEFLNKVESDGRAYGPLGKQHWIKWLRERAE